MASPWFGVPLSDYERHMTVLGQMQFLAQVFGETVRRCGARSVLVAGCAGGNGFDTVHESVRLVGVDLLPEYLADAARRYPRARFIAADLTRDSIACEPVELVHAALVFEHCGIDGALANCTRLVAPGGRLSVVLQLPVEAAAVAATGVSSVQALKECFRFIDRAELEAGLDGFVLESEKESTVGEKRFWQGVWRLRGNEYNGGMTSRTYHVYRDENVWAVKKLGRSAKTFSTRREAIAAARVSVAKTKPGQILVHGNDGNIVKRENHGLAVRPKLPYKSPNAAKIRRAVALAVLEQVKAENHGPRGN